MAQIKYVDNGTSAHIIKHEFTYQVGLDEGDQSNLYIIRILEKEIDYSRFVY